jgi:hypothetical protein
MLEPMTEVLFKQTGKGNKSWKKGKIVATNVSTDDKGNKTNSYSVLFDGKRYLVPEENVKEK